jgi:hypothetical protein
MHNWGGNFKYFADVGSAADEIGEFCKKWARINVLQTKEKYGTARVYCSFTGFPNIHNIIWPSYYYIQWRAFSWFGKVMEFVDTKIVDNIIYYSGINYIFVPYQKFIYRLAYKRAMKKYPHIKAEIKHGANWDELLKGLCTKN